MLGDDAISAPVSLGFQFPYPGGQGTTTSIEISSNGYVYLEPGTITGSRCCAPSLLAFALDAPSIAVFGNDLDPSAGRGVYFETDGLASAVVTWLEVPEFGTSVPYDIQLRLNSDGSFALSYRNVTPQILNAALVGYSPGGGASNSGAIDLSTFATGNPAGSILYEVFPPLTGWDLDDQTVTFVPDGAGSHDVIPGPLQFTDPIFPVAIHSDAAPNLGRTVRVSLHDLPSTTVSAALLLGTTAINIPLDPVGMIGCSLYVDNVFASPTGVRQGNRADFDIPIQNDPTSIGLQIFAQGTIVASGVNSLGIATSNQGTMTIGSDPALFAVIEGGSSGAGNAAAGGYFRLHYPGSPATASSVVRVDWNLATATSGRIDFDTDGLSTPRQFHHGNGAQPGCNNAFYGTDVSVGLVYGGPGQPASGCDPAATTGWVGSNPGIGIGYFAELSFSFTSFEPGEVFAFDCDTDFPFPNTATSHAGATITVTLEDGTVVSGRLAPVPGQQRLEVVLIP